MMKKTDLSRLAALSAAEISDALDACQIQAAIADIRPLVPGQRIIGPAFTVEYQPYDKPPASFQNAGNYIDEVSEGQVIFIDNTARGDCTVWGDILTTAALQKGLAGTVVHGAVRDADMIRQSGYPVACRSLYMQSGKNRTGLSAVNQPIRIGETLIRSGDIISADEHGVLVIPAERFDEVLEKAIQVQETEQAIMTALREGMPLREAREKYHYHKPWEKRVLK